jgi:N-glycosylase/DNA lyase
MMSQIAHIVSASCSRPTRYSDPDDAVFEGIRWGRIEELLTPAFWAHQCALRVDSTDPKRFRVGESLAEDFAICLLAGYGVPAEVGIEAASRLKAAGLLIPSCAPSRIGIEGLLAEPLSVMGHSVRYRFYRTKASYLCAGLQALHKSSPPEDDPKAFRAWFMRIPGVGPKTASFIARNWLGSDEVAILDVHVVRACQAVGLFGADVNVARDYCELERRFLDFAQAIGVKASWLDAIMWEDMRILSLETIAQYSVREAPDAVRRRGVGTRTRPLVETVA